LEFPPGGLWPPGFFCFEGLPSGPLSDTRQWVGAEAPAFCTYVVYRLGRIQATDVPIWSSLSFLKLFLAVISADIVKGAAPNDGCEVFSFSVS
jgi:hypothetical protein